MSIIEAIILGLIQGLTEFLPVSSSGHIILGDYILGVASDEKLLFIIVVHLATALSTVVVYRTTIAQIFSGLLTFHWNPSFRFSLLIVISMIPAAIAGFLIEDPLEYFLNDPAYQYQVLVLVGICLLITGLLLLFSDRAKTTKGKIKYGQSLIIGLAQALAILPGISRSGATISTSLLLKVNRENAARFSFLMVLPVIAGAMLKKGLDLAEKGIGDINILSLIIGFVAAFVAGFIACKWMIRLVQNSKLKFFAVYCFVIGIATIIYTML